MAGQFGASLVTDHAYAQGTNTAAQTQTITASLSASLEQSKRGFMNPSETAIKLEQSVFNSDETEILATAFEKAWAFVEFDPKLEALEESKRRSELARYLMKLLKLGEMNPTSLANSAIRVLRENHKTRVIKFDARRKRGDRSGSGLGRRDHDGASPIFERRT
jgi:hypothetical protein